MGLSKVRSSGGARGGSRPPTTFVTCCSLSADMQPMRVESCFRHAAGTGATVTWVAAIEWLPRVVEHVAAGDGPAGVALEVPAESLVSQAALRDLLVRAAAAAPGLDAAVCRGTVSSGQRRLLVDHGIRVVGRQRFEDATRGSRRPAPAGWPCRSELWGLWEVVMSTDDPPGMMGRLLPWGAAQGPGAGGLTVLDLSGEGVEGRMARWQSWMDRQGGAGAVAATLSALPVLIAGAARAPVGGSILRAA